MSDSSLNLTEPFPPLAGDPSAAAAAGAGGAEVGLGPETKAVAQQSAPLSAAVPAPAPTRFLPLLVEFIDCLQNVFVILTRERRAAFVFLSTPGGIATSVILVLLQIWITSGDSFWQRYARRNGVARILNVSMALSVVGLILQTAASVHAVVWMDCAGLLLTFLCRPTEPVVMTTVTYNPKAGTLTKQVRLRTIGMSFGVILGVGLAATVWAADESGVNDMMAGCNTVICALYIATALAIYPRLSNGAGGSVLPDLSPAGIAALFPHTDELNLMLTDGTVPPMGSAATAERESMRQYIRYITWNAFADRLTQLLLLGTAIYYTGMGRTMDSLIAMAISQCCALFVLTALPFRLERRKLIYGLRGLAGVALGVIAIAVASAKHDHSGDSEPAGTEVVWVAPCLLVFVLLVYGGDQPLLEVARLSMLRVRTSWQQHGDGIDPASDSEFRKTMYQYTLGGISAADLVAFTIYVAILPLGEAAVVATFLVVGVVLVATTLLSMAAEGHVKVVHDMLRKTPESLSSYAAAGGVPFCSVETCCRCCTGSRVAKGGYARALPAERSQFSVAGDADEEVESDSDGDGDGAGKPKAAAAVQAGSSSSVSSSPRSRSRSRKGAPAEVGGGDLVSIELTAATTTAAGVDAETAGVSGIAAVDATTAATFDGSVSLTIAAAEQRPDPQAPLKSTSNSEFGAVVAHAPIPVLAPPPSSDPSSAPVAAVASDVGVNG